MPFVDHLLTRSYFSRVKLRATRLLTFGPLGVASILSACSSFGSAPAPAQDDASVALDAATASDAAIDPTTDAAVDARPNDDASNGCRTIVFDDFDGRTPDASWRLDPPNGQRDFSTGAAMLSIPAGEQSYSVLATSPLRDPDGATPSRVRVDLDVVSSRLDAPGVTIAQFPDLTDNGNVRIAAIPKPSPAPGGRQGLSLLLVPNGPPLPSPTTLDLEAGEIARVRLEYVRSGDDLTVSLTFRDRPGVLSITTKAKKSADSAYFQMGPFSDRGPLSAMATVSYDNVSVQACSR